MKTIDIGLLIVALTGSGLSAYSQAPAPSPSPAAVASSSPRIFEEVAQILSGYDAKTDISRERRQQAYSKLFEAERFLYQMFYQRSRAGQVAFADKARSSFIETLRLDPTLSEAYVSLVEISLLTSTDIDEAASLCRTAIRFNKNSVGGHKFLARILTKQSGLRGLQLDEKKALEAIGEWNEVTRLDPRSAEAWAMLSEFYERTDRKQEAIDSLRKWVAASSPLDAGWYRQIIGGRPEEISPEEAQTRLSSALVRAGRTEEAIDLLSQMLADDPDNSDYMAQVQEAIELADPKNVQKAMLPLRQIVLSHPGSINLLSFYASLIAKTGNLDDAVKLLGDSFAKVQASDRVAAANLQIALGDIYALRDRIKDAVAAYEKALVVRGLDQAATLDPEEREFAMSVFDKLITAYKRANRIEDAKAVILRARKLLGKDDLFSDRQLISLYREMGNRTEALATVQNLRQRNLEDVTLLRLEATLLTETGQVDKAVELIKQRIASGKGEVPLQRMDANGRMQPRLDDEFSNYIFISQLYSQSGRASDSVSAAEQASAVAASEEQRQIARLMAASAYQKGGKYAEAEGILRDILKKTPGNPIAMNNLGYFLLERGERFQEAFELISRAIAIDPTNPSYLDSLGWAYFKLGKLDDAIRRLEEALKQDGASATAHEHLGDVYQKKGNIEQARNAWKKASVLTASSTDASRIKEKLDSLK